MGFSAKEPHVSTRPRVPTTEFVKGKELLHERILARPRLHFFKPRALSDLLCIAEGSGKACGFSILSSKAIRILSLTSLIPSCRQRSKFLSLGPSLDSWISGPQWPSLAKTVVTGVLDRAPRCKRNNFLYSSSAPTSPQSFLADTARSHGRYSHCSHGRSLPGRL